MLRSVNDLNVSAKHKRQLNRAVERFSNEYAEQWLIPSLIVDSKADAIPHLFKKERSSFLHFDLKEMIDEHLSDDCKSGWDAILAETVLLTNPLKVGDFDPSARIVGKHSGGTPPSERVRNGGWLVLTYEVDAQTREELEMQLDWFAGKQECCAFSAVHKSLSAFSDYRGYSAIFTGNKSVHINLIFDTRHLSKALLPDKPRYRSLWKRDVPDDLLPLLYRKIWREVAAVIQEQLLTDLKFDPLLSSYIQKRRSPWGIRTLERGSKLHDFEPGDQFCQIVLQERVARKILAPEGASAMFDMDKATDLRDAVRCADRRPSAIRVQSERSEELVQRFQDYLQRSGWPEFPQPVALRFDGEHNIAFFKNDAADVHPSTIVRGDYRRLLCAGSAAPATPMFLPNELNLDQTLALLGANGSSDTALHRAGRANKSIKIGKPLISATDIGEARKMSAPVFRHAASSPGPTLIQGPEGLGKTFSLMAAISDLRIEDDLHLVENSAPGQPIKGLSRGFTGFACRSEAQLLEKMKEYQNLDPSNHAIQLPSFSSLYSKALDLTDTSKTLSRVDAGLSGEPSLLHLIKAQQPQVFAEMVRLRDALWKTKTGQPVFHADAVVFLVHGLLKVWPHATFTRGFLHPDCPSDLNPQRLQACADQMSFRRVIYDEVSVGDLVSIIPGRKVKLSFKVAKACKSLSGKPWDEATLSNRAQAYNQVLAAESLTDSDFNYDTCDQIIRQKLRKKKDRHRVDVDKHPFGKGTEKKNIYRQVDGWEYYCKPQRWLWSLGCPVVVLTTEDLPRLVASGFTRREKQVASKKRLRIINMTDTPHLHRDHVPLVFDERARSERLGQSSVTDLAKELLSSGFDFVLSNNLRPSEDHWKGRAMSHEGARGRNDMIGTTVASILLYPSLEQYAELCVLGEAFGISMPMIAAYCDQVYQSLGRNLGFRYVDGQPEFAHAVYIKASLFQDLGCLKGQNGHLGLPDRYQFFLAQ
ncbi:MAG: hypothetical protein AAFQ47_08840 [Pseudomonadota bacterium]